MTVISQKNQERLLQQLHEEEKRLNKLTTIATTKKAGYFTCLFLCNTISLFAQNWLTTPALMEAHYNALNLNNNTSSLSNNKTPQAYYIQSLGEALEVMITEEETRFEDFEEHHDQRITELKKGNTADHLFAMAELRLQAAFVFLKFGHEFDAAWSIRQAYLTAATCKKKFPKFKPIKKTVALLDIMLGAVPEKYHWILTLLNMHGSSEKGLTALSEFQTEDRSLHLESALLYNLIHGYVLQETTTAVTGMREILIRQPNFKTGLFLTASLALKDAQSELALQYLTTLKKLPEGTAIPFVDYFLGEVYLNKGGYDLAIKHYQSFLADYRGKSYVKDANFKIAMCYWLNNQPVKANEYAHIARHAGSEATEADKYAARTLTESSLPHPQLTRLRYATDGGYYDDAKKILETLDKETLRTQKDHVEFTYRAARLHHKTQALDSAKMLYIKTIELTKNEHWYFAPNACLQLGYLFEEENNIVEAKRYFTRALEYKKHEYKNSIDAKAKSALAKLP